MTDFQTGDTIDLSDADFTIFTYVDSVDGYCQSPCDVSKLTLHHIAKGNIQNAHIIIVYIVYSTIILSYLLKLYPTYETARI